MDPFDHFASYGHVEGRPMPIRGTLGKEISRPEKSDAQLVKGFLETSRDSSVINGWIAVSGDFQPRTARIVFPHGEVRLLANLTRQDLKDRGINDGRHGFSVSVPLELYDGKTHLIQLIDGETGREISRRKQAWTVERRAYANLEEFLAYSLTQPSITAPFSENDKRVFATMEVLANRFESKGLAAANRPKFSVIMPVYNRADTVKESIGSILAQSYPWFEVIVVDDGSTDDSADIVEAVGDDRVKLIRLVENRGHTRARNVGFDAATGDIVAYLDSDNTWDSRYLAAVAGLYAERPDLNATVSGRLVFRGQEKMPHSVMFGHLNFGLLDNRNYLDTNCITHRRSLFEGSAPFDASLRRYVDYDLCLRLSDLGHFASAPLLLCNYYLHRTPNAISSNKPEWQDLDRIREKHEERRASILAAAARQPLKRPVTVVIPNWESLDDLRDCVAALQSGEWDEQLSVVVVDNNSSHAVVSAIREMSGLRLVENAVNYGFTYAVNQGIATAAQDDDILILNNDAIVRPGAIQELQAAAYELPDAGLTVPRQILEPQTKTMRTHVPYADPDRPVDVNISAHHRNVVRIGLIHDGGPVELTFAPFFATYIRRDVIDEVGPLDAEFGRHYRSDRVYCDLVRQVARRKIYHVPTAHVVHKLQRATECLRKTNDSDFDLMFKKNRWSEQEMASLGYRRAHWDI
ncbi:glycosyltransferase [Aestuariibius sp. 2305UL40-4]|uniref:glycosyltransferase n=1 Tax=Aestuariibius violaceus TaxID=3234132 RepID=UPI003493746C